MLLMLIAALLLVAQMLGAGEADRVLLLNFAGVKAWGAPLRRGDSLAAGVVVNALGLFLLTTPDGRRERSMSLRRWLRVYVIAAVTASGFIASRHFDWLLIEGYSTSSSSCCSPRPPGR
jgi:hypothetical protein